MVGKEPVLKVIQDGKFETLSSLNLNLSGNQRFQFQVPAAKLGIDLSESGDPIYNSSLDLFLQVKFDFYVSGQETYTDQISYGSFRIHFEIEKEMSTSDREKRWQITLL